MNHKFLWEKIRKFSIREKHVMNSLKETQRNSNHQLFEVLDTLSENVKNMKLEIKKLSDETKENRRLLGAIADQNSIYMDDDDSESVL